MASGSESTSHTGTTDGPPPGGKWSYSNPSVGMRLKRLVWAMVQGSLYRCSFHTWNGWRALLLKIFGAKIGGPVVLRRTSRVYYPWLLEMGAHSTLGDSAEVYNLAMVRIGENVTISQEAYLCAGSHDYTRADMQLMVASVEVEPWSWVCARAFVGPGVTVRRGAIVGAAAVVSRDVEPWTIVAGNPAKKVKDRPALKEAGGQ